MNIELDQLLKTAKEEVSASTLANDKNSNPSSKDEAWRQSGVNEAIRSDAFKAATSKGVSGLFAVAIFCISTGYIVYALNIVLPTYMCWLAGDRLEKLERILTYATLGGLLSNRAKELLAGASKTRSHPTTHSHH